jgi:hypothetical protein
MLLLVLGYIYPEYRLLQDLPEFVTNQVIAQIVPVYITVETFLLAFGTQLKNKLYRDLFVVGAGIPAILTSVYTFSAATYGLLQVKISSTNTLTMAFQSTSFLFLLVVELFAVGVLIPEKVPKVRARRPKIVQTP